MSLVGENGVRGRSAGPGQQTTLRGWRPLTLAGTCRRPIPAAGYRVGQMSAVRRPDTGHSVRPPGQLVIVPGANFGSQWTVADLER